MSSIGHNLKILLKAHTRELGDAVEPFIKRHAAAVCLFTARTFKFINPKRSLTLAMASSRYRHCSSAIALVKFQIDRHPELPLQLLSEADTFEDAAERSIVLQWPVLDEQTVVEKGILVISFTSVFPWFLRFCDCQALSQYFHIVLEPSFAGYLDADILGWIAKVDAPIFVQCTEETDRVALNALDKNLIPVSVGASNWVDHERFKPVSKTQNLKTYDSIYVANSAPFKRVFRYLKAVKNIVASGHHDYKGALACAGWGDRKQDILDMAAHYGVTKHIDIHFALAQNELIELINQAQVNLLLSRKEGSNRSLFESMFCDLPSLCLADVIGPNRAYFNEYTGMLAEDDLLENALLKIRKDATNYAPRSWAMTNITPAVTTQHLIEIIEHHSGRPISTEQIYIKINAPESMYPGTEIKEVWRYHERLLRIFENGSSSTDRAQLLAQLKTDFCARYPDLPRLKGESVYSQPACPES